MEGSTKKSMPFCFKIGIRNAITCWLLVMVYSLCAAEPQGIRIKGSATTEKYLIDGKTVRIKHTDRFQVDIDEQGRWLIDCESSADPGAQFNIGYDGTNTAVMVYFSGKFSYENDTNKTETLTRETATSLCSIYPGNEWPFDLWPPSKLAWFAFASHGYMTNAPRKGRIGDLFKSMDFMPVCFALKAKPTFMQAWPHLLESAELFFDMTDYPKDPLGLVLPGNEMDYAMARDCLKELLAKTSGVKAGVVRSMNPKEFGGRVLPSEYVLEMTFRGTDVPDNTVGIDHLSGRTVLKVSSVESIGLIEGRPPFIGPGALVKDFRFRHVDDSTAMEYLPYQITDKRWKSAEDATLKLQAMHNRNNSPRFGNSRNKVTKYLGVVLLVLVFLFPVLRKIFSMINSPNNESQNEHI